MLASRLGYDMSIVVLIDIMYRKPLVPGDGVGEVSLGKGL